jgi:hypothetical protein
MDPVSPNPLPDLVLWRGDGCHLCDDARVLVTVLLAERAAAGRRIPAVVERKITDDPAIERELFEQIPVLELGGSRLPLAIRAGAIRSFLAAALERAGAAGDGASGDGPDFRPGRPG